MAMAAPRGQPAPELPVDRATAFPEGGFFVRRANQARQKLLDRIAPALSRALAPGETIRYAARGAQYFALEYALSGFAVAQWANFTALVLTDRRLLLLQVSSRGKLRDVKNQVRLSELRGAKKRFSSLDVHLADGKKLRFVSIPGRDAKALAALLGNPVKAPKSPERSVEHLCPMCLTAIPGPVGATTVCLEPSCRIPFRDPKRAAVLSAIVPGVGDLYLRHHLFGAFEFLKSMILTAAAIWLVREGVAGGEGALVGIGVAVFVLPRVLDGINTLRVGRKGLVPLAEKAQAGVPRSLPAFPGWAWGVFALGIGILGLALLAGIPEALASGAVRRAEEAARAGRLDEAHARWAAAEKGASSEGRARMALALYRAGDPDGAEELLGKLANVKIDAKVAKDLDAQYERYHRAYDDYGAGVKALAAGKDAEALRRFDLAVPVFKNMRRPHLPASRGEAVILFAGSVLAPPVDPPSIARAEHALALAGDAAPPAMAALVRARLAAARGRTSEALAAVRGIDLRELEPAWQLLALETRAAAASSAAERAEVASAARALPEDQLGERNRARREALAGDAVTPAALPQ